MVENRVIILLERACLHNRIGRNWCKFKARKRYKKLHSFKKNCFLDVEASICKKNFCYALSQLLNPCTREIFACFNDATNFFFVLITPSFLRPKSIYKVYIYIYIYIYIYLLYTLSLELNLCPTLFAPILSFYLSGWKVKIFSIWESILDFSK